MRGHVFYRGHRYVLAQDPPAEEVPEDKPEDPAAPAEPDATVEDELGGVPAPEDQERDQNLSDLGLEGGGGEDAAKEGPKVEDPDQVSREIEESPASNWKEYEQPILKDIKQQFGGVPISLLNPQIETDVDVDLGFHITGYVKFLGEVPHAVQDEYGDVPLHFKVFVDPDGKLQRSSLTFYTELDNH